MKIKLEKITEYQSKQCRLFSEYSVYSSLKEYKKRNQTDKDKIINDIYIGKVAEFMVYNFLINSSKKLQPPDINIYDEYKKTYSADLILNNANIHVKSHKLNNSYPVSWVFQKNDPLLKNKNKNDFLALVVLNVNQCYMYLYNITQVKFRQPIKEALKVSKLCVYEKDVYL